MKRWRHGRRIVPLIASAALVAAGVGAAPMPAAAAVSGGGSGAVAAGPGEKGGASLESAAAKAGATVLAFRRDFKEAAGVFAVGIVSVLLATPAGVNLLRDTVTSLFGGSGWRSPPTSAWSTWG